MAENIENNGCLQRDSAEHEGYAKASRSFNRIWKERDSAQPRLLEAILYKDNFNRAYKRVKANKGAPGIDGMTIEEALPYLKEHQREITDRIYRGKYTPSPVRRVKIPSFTPPIHLEDTPFRLAVWDLLSKIPYGEVVTYKELAGEIARQKGIPSMSTQAIGGAVGHNPISIIIPCHRVVGSDGSLTGYAGGIDKKRSLLTIERVPKVS